MLPKCPGLRQDSNVAYSHHGGTAGLSALLGGRAFPFRKIFLIWLIIFLALYIGYWTGLRYCGC